MDGTTELRDMYFVFIMPEPVAHFSAGTFKSNGGMRLRYPSGVLNLLQVLKKSIL